MGRVTAYAEDKTITMYSEERDLENLLALAHFLKGSAATLGIYKVRDACEKIQHLAAGRDESGFEHIG